MINPYPAVYRAIKEGTLVRPDSCSECGKRGPVHGHHSDYSEPLAVEWLCPSCHSQRHAEIPTGAYAAGTGTHVFQVRLPPDRHKELAARASEEHRSVNGQVVYLIERYLENAAQPKGET